MLRFYSGIDSLINSALRTNSVNHIFIFILYALDIKKTIEEFLRYDSNFACSNFIGLYMNLDFSFSIKIILLYQLEPCKKDSLILHKLIKKNQNNNL